MEAADRSGGGTWSAPGRVNLVGEHTDYTGGLALPFALDRRTTVRGARREDGTIRVSSAGHGEATFPAAPAVGEVEGWAAYVAGVAWALAEAGHDIGGADLQATSDVPSGGGLSSSHSLEVAVALALTGLHGLDLDRTALALLVQRAENGYVGAPTGVLDQLASLHGQEGHAVLLDTRAMTAEPVPCDLAGAGLRLLVVDTGSPHQLADGEYGARRETCHAAERALGVEALRDVGPDDLDDALARLDDPVAVRRVRHVVTENERVREAVALLRGGRLRDLGPVLTASHESLRTDFEVSSDRLDATVTAALGAGALGARLVGGGFGGSAIALVEAEALPEVERAVRDAFAGEGWEEPGLLTATPSRGAGRDA